VAERRSFLEPVERGEVMDRYRRGRVRGVLEDHGESFRAKLLAEGYTEGSAAHQVLLMAHFSRWLERRGLTAQRLDRNAVAAFLTARRSEGYVRLLSSRAMAPMVEYLLGVGVMADEVLEPKDPVQVLLGEFEDYLVTHRGLAAASVRSYVGVARRFLSCATNGKASDLRGLSAATVASFICLECGRRGPGSAGATVTGTRAWLRFLYATGGTHVALSGAVPSVANWSLRSLPRSIGARDLASLLGSCDRRRAVGRRDFAILVLCARLGLRAGEVARLELGDIDWRRGDVAVRGKGGRLDRLPLPVDVGEAITGWLTRGRPDDARTTAVFLRMRAPCAPLESTGVSAVVRRASRRAGLEPIGAHRLRHTAASRMLAAGGNLSEIGQVLRHELMATTALYAKVDHTTLKAVAQPWPQP
jgi:site-specific recombinase XerD